MTGFRRSTRTVGRRALGWFADRPIAWKIFTSAMVMAFVAVLVGGVALVKTDGLNAGTRAVAADGSALRYLAEAQRIGTAQRADLRDHMLTNGADMEKFAAAIAADDAALAAALSRFEAVGTETAEERKEVAHFWELFHLYQQVRDHRVLPPSVAGDKIAAYTVLTVEAVVPYNDAMAVLARLMVQQQEKSAAVTARADRDYRTARNTLLVLLACGLLVAVPVAAGVTRSIVVPLRRVQEVLLAVSRGDLTRQADVEQRDEVGQMARALRTATEGLRVPVRAMSSCADAMARATTELTSVNAEIAAMAEETTRQAEAVSSSADGVSRNVRTAAEGAVRMAEGIERIARDAARAAEIGAEAVRRAQDATTSVAELGESSTEIGEVVRLISSIAEQTNLLSLNATIEAARAGEAGKGFAVVAGEVKELAGETARATEDIDTRVAAIQSGTTGVVGAITGVAADMTQINEYQNGIAAAVDEQSATSATINRNVADAAAGSSDIAARVSGIADAARNTSAGVVRTRRAAEELAAMSAELRQTVAGFRH
jgi:methyl-accepting chemotaxis protein